MKWDVVIVGGRCAGASLALLLARRGVKVLVLEKARFPSDTLSTCTIWPRGISILKRWNVLDKVAASGCLPMEDVMSEMGDYQLVGVPSFDGNRLSYAPRRYVLDKILLDSAREAGAEVREGFSVDGLLFEGDRAVGVRGRTRSGEIVDERADLIVGADGKNSVVASRVRAPKYFEKAALCAGIYSFWSGLSLRRAEIFVRGGLGMFTAPTNDDLTIVVAVVAREQAEAFAKAPLETLTSSAARVETLQEKLRHGKQESNLFIAKDLPNFFKKPAGKGWALVGDAAYTKDPGTGQGISDAFAHAELLAAAILSSKLDEYEARRNDLALPNYEFTYEASKLKTPSEKHLRLRAALADLPEDRTRYMEVVTGCVNPSTFYSPSNLQRISGSADKRETA